MDANAALLDLLPGELRNIGELIGVEGALRLPAAAKAALRAPRQTGAFFWPEPLPSYPHRARAATLPHDLCDLQTRPPARRPAHGRLCTVQARGGAQMMLSRHFSLAELVASDYALRHGLDNTPDDAARANLYALAALLEDVRETLGGVPIYVTSGYRSPALNRAVGGSRSSAHLEGRAADFVCPAAGSPLDICTRLVRAGLLYDQLIEEGRWVHIAIPEEHADLRREVLTAHFERGRVTYSRGLA